MNEEHTESLPKFDAGETDVTLDRKLKNNARAIKRSHRIRWISRGILLLSSCILLLCFFYPNKLPFMAGLACPAIVLFFLSLITLFMTGGIAPASTRVLLSDREKRLLDD